MEDLLLSSHNQPPLFQITGEMEISPLPVAVAEPNIRDKPPLVPGASIVWFLIENILSDEALFTKGPSGAAGSAQLPIGETVPGAFVGVTATGTILAPS